MSKTTIKASPIRIIILALMTFSLPACNMQKKERLSPKIEATSPQAKVITLTQQYVCQIHSQRLIKIRAFADGLLEAAPVTQGQAVKEGDLMFKIVPILLNQARQDTRLAKLESNYTQKLYENKVVSSSGDPLLEMKMLRANAKARVAAAELDFATVKAPFDGIIDTLRHQQGSLVEEGEVLATLSNDSLVWVDFNVPEARYLEYMSDLQQHQDELQIELILPNGKKFEHVGNNVAIAAGFNNETGSIPFRADFPNPDHLLRHGQTGTVLISRVQKDAIVIPQRATFEVQNKRYVYVVDKKDVAHQREIVIQNELDDLFVVKSGLGVDDRIILEGIRQVDDGKKVQLKDRVQKKG